MTIGVTRSTRLCVTTTVEPRLNPALDDVVFRFRPPDAYR